MVKIFNRTSTFPIVHRYMELLRLGKASTTSSWSIYFHKTIWSLNVVVPRKESFSLGYFLGNNKDENLDKNLGGIVHKPIFQNSEFYLTIIRQDVLSFLLNRNPRQPSWSTLWVITQPTGGLETQTYSRLATKILLLDSHGHRA